MAFKGGGMRTLVRAHDEVPCITAIITSEIRRRISAHQHSLSGAKAILPGPPLMTTKSDGIVTRR
jgi:hypothetical protein